MEESQWSEAWLNVDVSTLPSLSLDCLGYFSF